MIHTRFEKNELLLQNYITNYELFNCIIND